MIQNIAYKIRIYPNDRQKELINKTIGCNRLMYNLMLSERKDVYEQYKTNKEVLYKWKYKTPKQIKSEYDFMKEVDSQSFNWTLVVLKDAYNNFYKSLKVKNGFGFPKFKKKKNGGSYTTSFINNNIKIDFKNHKTKLPILGWIKYRDNRIIDGTIKHATVSKDTSDHYFISYTIQQEIPNINYIEKVKITKQSKIIGLDMSLSNFFVDSNGNSPAYEKQYKNRKSV